MRRGQGGFTLVELLGSIVILGIIGYVLTEAFILGLVTTDATADRLTSSTGAQVLSTYYWRDVQSSRCVTEARGSPVAPSAPFTVLQLRLPAGADSSGSTTTTTTTLSPDCDQSGLSPCPPATTTTTSPVTTSTTSPVTTSTTVPAYPGEEVVAYVLAPSVDHPELHRVVTADGSAPVDKVVVDRVSSSAACIDADGTVMLTVATEKTSGPAGSPGDTYTLRARPRATSP